MIGDLPRATVVRPTEDLRGVARSYVEELGAGSKVKQSADALARFIGDLAALPGVEALALVSSCQPGCRPVLSNSVFASWEVGAETAASTVRTIARANAALFGGASPQLPNGGLGFIHTHNVDFSTVAQDF